MTWFDFLMTCSQNDDVESSKEFDWHNVDNWTPRYNEAGASNRWSLVLNEHIQGFQVGKSYKINIELVDENDVPSYFYFIERDVVDGTWQQVSRTMFTQSQSAGILTKEANFTVENEDRYYVLWTNRPKAEFPGWLDKIKSITITEV